MSFPNDDSDGAASDAGFSTDTPQDQQPLPHEITTRTALGVPPSVRVAVWRVEHRKAFASWWATTTWHQADRATKIGWDSRKKASSVWKSWEAVAWIKDGKPGAQCDRCGRVMGHHSDRNIGSSHLTKHYNSSGCQAKAEKNGKGPLAAFVSSRPGVGLPLFALQLALQLSILLV